MTYGRKFKNGGHAPTRYFGTWMGFTSQGGGQWVGEMAGFNFTIEKRRAEAGCPSGWYYFGPGRPDGVYCGERPEDAAEMAISFTDARTLGFV